MNHGIPTIYRGIEYRSRLEARWAAFFDLIGWRHTYEPFDGNGYIPDFLIHGRRPFLAEIKPAATKEQFEVPISKIEAGLSGLWTDDVLILGADPQPDFGHRDPDWPDAGIFGQWEPACSKSHDHQDRAGWSDPLNWCDQTVPAWHWAVGDWMTCRYCHQLSASHTTNYWTDAIPCGHGSDTASHSNQGRVAHGRLAAHWAEACNAVKWHGRDAS